MKLILQSISKGFELLISFLFLFVLSIPIYLLGTNAFAFDEGHKGDIQGPNGNCFSYAWDAGNITYPGEHNTARIALSDYSEQAGGLGWRFNVKSTEGMPNALTVAGIESLCGYHDVTIISQSGADAGSFSAEDYIGVTFSGRETAGGALYDYEVAISGVTGTVLINSATPNGTPNTVSFPTIPDIQFGDYTGEPFGGRNSNVLTSTGVPSLGLGVTATAGYLDADDFSASGPCEISNYYANQPNNYIASVVATGVGVCTVTASHYGNATYAPATPVSQSFTISKGDQAIVFNHSDPETRTFSENSTFGIASVAVTNGNTDTFAPNEASSRLMVNYTSQTTDVCTVGTSTLSTYYANPSVYYFSGADVTMLQPGTCTIVGSQAGDANFNAAPDETQTFNITGPAVDANLDIANTNLQIDQAASAFTPVSATGGYGTLTYAVSPSLPAGLNFNTANGEITGTPTAASANAYFTVTVTDEVNASNSAIFGLAIDMADQTLVFSAPANQGFTQGGTASLTATPGASTSPVTFASNSTSVCTVSGSTATIVSAGICSITASQAEDANYNAAPDVTDTFAIGKADQSITASATRNAIIVAQTSTVTASGGDGTGAISYAVTSGAAYCSISNNVVTGIGVGSCIVTATKAADTYYIQATATASISVGKAAATIALNSNSSNPQQGETVTYNAVLTSPVAISGTVDFYNGKDSMCMAVAVSANAASCEYAFNQAGTKDVTAIYSGDASNSTASSNVLNPTVEDTVGMTSQMAQKFVQQRSNHILNNQPSMISQLTGTSISGGGPLGLLKINGNEHEQKFFFSTSRSKILKGRKFYQSAGLQTTAHALGYAPTVSNNSDVSKNTDILGFKRIEDPSSSDDDQLNFDGDNTFDVSKNRAGKWDVWTEIYGSHSNIGEVNSSLWVGYVGAHYFVEDKKIIGLIAQVDWSEEEDPTNGSKADGRGWMIGPYIAGKFKDQALFYEASIRYGRSENNISPMGTFTDQFDTERLMISGILTGEYKQDEITIRPELGLTWYEEKQEAYTDSLNNTIPENIVSFGELRFGPTFSQDLKLENGALFSPKLGVKGVYNFDLSDSNTSQGATPGRDELRARLSAGFTSRDPNSGIAFSAEGFYDGIGISDFETYGGRAKVTMPLH